MELFKTEEFDIKKNADLQLYFCVSSCLAKEWRSPIASGLEEVMNVFRKVMTTHRKNLQICSQALNLLRSLAPRLADSDDLDKPRTVVAHMIRAFWKLRETYAVTVRLEMAKCMEAYLKVDPEGEWTNVEQDKKDKTTDTATFVLRKEFARLLADGSHSVRAHMAQAIGSLFVVHSTHDEVVPAQKHVQYVTFEQVAKVLASSLVIPANFGDDESEDEGVNRSSSMLAALKCITLASPVCEKKAIALMFQAIKERFLDQELVIKVLSQLADKLGFSTKAAYIDSHLAFIVDNWLNHGFQITDFPYQTLGFTVTAEFLRHHSSTILPQLISRPDTMQKSIQLFTEQVNPGGDCTDYIVQNFCPIVASLVPWFAVQSRREGDTQELIKEQGARSLEATRSYEYLKDLLTPQTVDKVLNKTFDEMVVQLLLRMYEPPDEGSDVAKFSRETDPEPNPPFFTSYAIKATLDFMTRCHPNETLVSVLCKTKDNIQKILLALSMRIADTHLVHEKRRVLSMYRLFVLLVLRELSKGLRNTWAFFIRDVIFSLRRIITAAEEVVVDYRRQHRGLVMDSDMFSPCCNLLHYVCESALQCCSQELGTHLHVIVSTLIPYAKGTDDRAQQALALLSYLIVENNDPLFDSIALLDPFPDTVKFQSIHEAYMTVKSQQIEASLIKEISHFVSVSSRSPPLSRVEGLKHLRRLLMSNKPQLHALLEDNKDVSSSSPIPDLVHELICLSSTVSSIETGTATDVKIEIANCLGEIGATDLAVIALTGRRKRDPLVPSPEVFSDATNSRNSTIVGHLNSYLTDKSVEVVEAAATCVKQILCTASGVTLLQKYEECKAEQLLWYLEPFRPRKKKSTGAASFIEETDQDVMGTLGNTELWIPKECSHVTWITTLTRTVIRNGAVRDEVLRLLAPVCQVKVEFAEQVFPYLIHNILEAGDEDVRRVLSEQIRGFFVHCSEASISSSTNSPLSPVVKESPQQVSKKSIRTMLNVINYLRTQTRPRRGRTQSTQWDNNFWLDLEYLDVAQAAQKCAAYFTALLYTEIWCDIQKSLPEAPMNITLPSHSQDINIEAPSQNTEGGMGPSYQALLLEIYSSIGEPDSVYGAGAGRLADIGSRIRTYEHEEDWDKALGAYDLQMQYSSNVQTGLLQALKSFGLYHVMQHYLKGLSADSIHSSTEVAELQYESAWRNCVWDVEMDTSTDRSTAAGFHQSVHTCLGALRDGESGLFESTLRTAKLRIVSDVGHISLESVRSVYPLLVCLQQLVELDEYRRLFQRPTPDTLDVVGDWKERFPLPGNDFEFLEPVLALRTSVLQTLVKIPRVQSTEGLVPIYKGLIRHLESQARLARQAKRPQVSEKALFTIRQLNSEVNELQSRAGVDLGVSWSWRVEEAKLRWARGERETAMHLLKMLTKQLNKVQDEHCEAMLLYPQALGLYGSWLAETRSENPSKIIEEYLEKATHLMESMEGDSATSPLEAFLSLARYADSQYQNIVDYMNSTDFENKQEIARKAKAEYDDLQHMANSDKDRYIRTLKIESKIDEEELRLMHANKMTFLHKAIENYVKTLQAGDKYDLRVFRLCSLWFDNTKEQFVNDVIKDSLSRIQSRKFLPLMYQLAARLGTKSYQNDVFQGTLNELIERTSVDHPHHTMFILMAVAHADRDHEYMIAGRKGGRDSKLARNVSKRAKGFVDEARLQAACNLIENISRQRGKQVQLMKTLCMAYIELAYVDVAHLKGQTGPFSIPDNLAIKKIANLREVAVPTMDVKVDPLCRYDDLVYVAKFTPTFGLAGGVNLPKIISCVGSDGVKRRQLVKGRDDLRQDAVMEQVFDMVNQLLVKNAETRKRKLKIRTYKVIPLSQRSGMLEWCEGTMPLGEYLIGRLGHFPGAHQRYYPKDWSPIDCRRKIAMCDQSRRTKAEVFQEIMDNFHPVFRHFFLEKFVDPAAWFERRLAYTRSCATCSIVGYIVGLGDRHVQNILVDCNTAELVHIDLGVAFEQGKVLPTPETVPFRLSRDLVDGMGVTGVEGVYRRCCEKTMDVMRTSQEALITILEVLLYDPLYSWTLSPEKKMALQAKNEADVLDASSTANTTGELLEILTSGEYTDNAANKMAERVLSRLKQKLNGIEENVQLSVSGQVNHLIREAMDTNNLCRLFAGWQPWI